MNPNAIAALTAATPNQHDLLDLLNNPERLSQEEVAQAEALLKLWYPMAHSVWTENQEMAAWLKEQGIDPASL